MEKKRFLPFLLWLGCGGAACLHVFAAMRRPIGIFNDDAFYLLLARSITQGHFIRPTGTPVTDPLPGFPLLLALPAWLLGENWELFRWLMIVPPLLLAALTWRAARRLLPTPLAGAAAALVGFNGVLIEHAGAVLPDVSFAALALALLAALGEKPSRRRTALLIGGAALACLMRPHGALLVLSMSLTIAFSESPRAAAVFAAGALSPLGAWLLRNRWVAGTVTNYVDNWSEQAHLLPNPLSQALELSRALFARGLLGLSAPPMLSALIGCAAAAAAAAGAIRLIKRRKEPTAAALAVYAALVLTLHLTWPFTAERYLLPLLPVLWIFILAGLEPWLGAGRGRAVAAGLLLALPGLLPRLSWLREAPSRPAELWPATMAVIRERTPSDALIQSLAWPGVSLWGKRAAAGPPLADSRDEWLYRSLLGGVTHVLTVGAFEPAGMFTPAMAEVSGRLQAWPASSRYLRLLHADSDAGAGLYELRHPDPERFLRAWRTFHEATALEKIGMDPRAAAAKLRQAVALEPELAYAWAALSDLEKNPSRRRERLLRAARADPSSVEIQTALQALKP